MSEPEELDPEAVVARKREDEALERIVELAQLKELLQDERTRDLLWRVLARCYVFRSLWDQNYGRMSLIEGGRQIGLWLLNEIIEADPNALMAMQLKAHRGTSEAARTVREASARKQRRS